jgi:GT2 family glycosyltransferase
MRQRKGEQPLVSVGIVTWNSEQHIQGCIDGLVDQSYRNIEIIVVDNASTDRSLDLLSQGLPECRIIRNGTNLGYCVAHNQAIRASLGAHYLPMNPDVRLSVPFIEKLVQVLEEHPDYGSASGKFWLPTDEGRSRVVDSAGLFIDRRRRQYLRGHGEEDHGQYDEAGEAFGADGAAPLYRRSTLEDVKVFDQYFDEAYFAYQEDVDLAWRGRLLGWKCWYEPSAVAVHSRRFRPGVRRPMPRHLRRIAVRNRYLTILKNEAPECWRRDWWRVLAYDLEILGYILLLEQSSLGAYPMLWRLRRRALAWRCEVWGRVIAPPNERLTWFVDPV